MRCDSWQTTRPFQAANGYLSIVAESLEMAWQAQPKRTDGEATQTACNRTYPEWRCRLIGARTRDNMSIKEYSDQLLIPAAKKLAQTVVNQPIIFVFRRWEIIEGRCGHWKN